MSIAVSNSTRRPPYLPVFASFADRPSAPVGVFFLREHCPTPPRVESPLIGSNHLYLFPTAKMPATAGRVRMPANNRVHSSAALQTHGIWQSAIGYDPYAPESKVKASSGKPDAEGVVENAYASFQGLLALARIKGSSTDDTTRGACKKCGRIGHLTFQCRNFLSMKEEKDEVVLQDATTVLDKVKKASRTNWDEEDGSSEEEDDSDSSDSEVDPEIERIIAARLGKNKKKTEGGEGSKGKKERRGRSKKRSGKRASCGSDDEDRGDEEEKEERRNIKEKRHRRRHVNSDDDSSEEERGKKERKRRRRRTRLLSRRPHCSPVASPTSPKPDGHICSRPARTAPRRPRLLADGRVCSRHFVGARGRKGRRTRRRVGGA